MRKLLLLIAAFFPLALSADTSITRGTWDLYRGTSIVSRHNTEAECIQAADNRNEIRTYTCRTRTTVVVTADAPPPPPPTPPAVCADGMDNDADGFIDLADPGCSSATDTDETNSAPPPTGGTMQPGNVFTADYSSSTGNWDGQAGLERSPGTMSQGRVAAGGPNARDAFQLVQRPGGGDEFYWGHVKQLSNLPAGTSRFYRFRLFHNSDNNYLALDGGRTINKLLILGESGGSGRRMILNANGYRNSNPAFEIIFDGWNSAPPEIDFTKGEWHSVQLEVRWGSSALIKVWIDTDAYASPTLQLSGNFSHPNNGYTHFGAYSNDGLASNGRHTWKHADFRIATTFDPGWHGSL